MFVGTDSKSLRVNVPADMREKWESFCERKKVKQQPAIEFLMRWMLAQDDLVQSMVLGQVESSPDLIKFVLERTPGKGAVTKLPFKGGQGPIVILEPGRAGS
jgi:hypothetical protein